MFFIYIKIWSNEINFSCLVFWSLNSVRILEGPPRISAGLILAWSLGLAFHIYRCIMPKLSRPTPREVPISAGLIFAWSLWIGIPLSNCMSFQLSKIKFSAVVIIIKLGFDLGLVLTWGRDTIFNLHLYILLQLADAHFRWYFLCEYVLYPSLQAMWSSIPHGIFLCWVNCTIFWTEWNANFRYF